MLTCVPVTINTFGHIHKVVKSDYKFHCVCLPVSPYGTTWLPVDRFHEILFSGFLLKSIEKIQFWLQLDKIKRHFSENIYLWQILLVTLPRLLMFLWLLCLPQYYGYCGECYYWSICYHGYLVSKVSIVPQLCYYHYQGYQTTLSRSIFLVFATWTNFNKDFSIHIILQNGTNPRTNLYRGINFVQQYLIFVGLSVWNLLCVTLLVPRIFQNFLNFWKICGPLLLSSLTQDTWIFWHQCFVTAMDQVRGTGWNHTSGAVWWNPGTVCRAGGLCPLGTANVKFCNNAANISHMFWRPNVSPAHSLFPEMW